MASHPLVLGVDVGGTKVAVGAVAGGRVDHSVERPTPTASTEALLQGIEAAIGEVSERAGRPTAIGVGVPSQIEFATGRIMSSVNIRLEGVALREELGERTGAPVFVDNDANCAALGEAQLVDHPPAQHLVMLTLGTGVGGGAIIDGAIFRGTHGLGAELGHFSVDADGPECPGNCPNRGCLEALCSGQALERDATEIGRERPDSPLGRVYAEHGRVTGRQAEVAARRGDPDARDLFDRFARWLGVGIAGYVNVFEPELVVIGGGLSRAADLFLDRAIEEAASRALPKLWERTGVSLARGGPDAGVIGAGVLAAQELARGVRDTQRTEATKGAR